MANEHTPLQATSDWAEVAVARRQWRRRVLGIGCLSAIFGLMVGIWLLATPSPVDDDGDPPLDWQCGTAPSEAGYVKLANKQDDQYFYWFVASSHHPAADPLVLWLTGGPGTSSMTALLTENGPCTIRDDLTAAANPYSWSQRANVIWLDQPTGVGFSYTSQPATDADKDEQDVGANIYWFMQGFYEKHPEFIGREFFITGESYGGHYVPGAAHYIWKQNTAHKGNVSAEFINLQGIAVGNGHTNPNIQYQHNVDMAFNSYNITLLSAKEIEQMRADSEECIRLVVQCQAAPGDQTACVRAQECWNTKLLAPFTGAHRNSYDIRKACFGNGAFPSIAVCGFNYSTIERYLARPPVRAFLGVRVPEWVEVNRDVTAAFIASGDFSMSYHKHVADLLDAGIRVLIYAGDADIVCNWAGNEAWTRALQWKGTAGFNAAAPRDWVVRDPVIQTAPEKRAGVVRAFENFSFVRIFEAGHMVPADQPAVALAMLNAFLANRPLA